MIRVFDDGLEMATKVTIILLKASGFIYTNLADFHGISRWNACNLNFLLDLINQFIDIGKHRGHRVMNLLSKIALRGESLAVWLDDRAHDDQSIR